MFQALLTFFFLHYQTIKILDFSRKLFLGIKATWRISKVNREEYIMGIEYW